MCKTPLLAGHCFGSDGPVLCTKVDVTPCKTQARFTIARGPGLGDGIAGKRASFQIIARDQGGNKRKKGGDTFIVEFDGPAEMKWARVEDHEDGLYTVTYFPTCSGW